VPQGTARCVVVSYGARRQVPKRATYSTENFMKKRNFLVAALASIVAACHPVMAPAAPKPKETLWMSSMRCSEVWPYLTGNASLASGLYRWCLERGLEPARLVSTSTEDQPNYQERRHTVAVVPAKRPVTIEQVLEWMAQNGMTADSESAKFFAKHDGQRVVKAA